MSEQSTNVPSEAELSKMSREELVRLGTKLDGVEVVYREPHWPGQDTRAEQEGGAI